MASGTFFLTDLSLEDNGNYTCEISGPHNTILGYVTHYIFVRGITVFPPPSLAISTHVLAYTHTYVRTRAHTNHTHTHAHAYTLKHTTHALTRTHTPARTHALARIQTYTCSYIGINTRTHARTRTHIHTHGDTHTHTHTHTH